MAPVAIPPRTDSAFNFGAGSLKAKPTTATVAGIINRVATLAQPEIQHKPIPDDITTHSMTRVARTPSEASSDTLTDDLTGAHLRKAFRGTANSVWVITSAYAGEPVGFTAITVNSVSVDPPMISFNIGRNSSSLLTLSRSLRFAVHLLAHDAGETAQRFSAAAEKRFADKNTWAWHNDGLPELFPSALSRLSGNVVTLAPAGDNLVVLGALDTITHRPGQPLVYHAGLYRALAPPQPAKSRIYLNAFDMCCVGHQAPGLWAHPSDRASTYKDLEYWTDLARLLDGGGFSSLFLADVVGIYDVYKGSRDAAVSTGTQVPVNDPTIPVSAMAAVTKKLGFGVTVSLTYELPYAFARRMSTLDHLTKGRVAWNVVTSYLKSAATNLGLETQIPHDTRYDIAEEFMEVCYKLWEGSWEDDAVVKDVAKRLYADPAKVHDINHDGTYFKVPGAHLSEPSPQRTPYIFQAGASSRGQEFAARHAEAVFVAGPSATHVKGTAAGIRKATAEQGRDPRDVKIFTLLTIITGPTDEAAQAKYDEYKQYASVEGALALYGGWAGVDLSVVDKDKPLEYVENDAIRSVNAMWSKQGDAGEVWTPRKIGEKIAIGGLGPVIVGSGPSIADQLERWIEEADIDGFNIAYAATPGSFEDVVEYVVPELRRRGRMPEEEGEDAPRKTLRERMGDGSSRAYVKKTHPAYGYKVSK